MRTRFAIISMLVVGVLLTSTAGAGMALSGSSGSGSAGTAQYGPPPSHHHGRLAPSSINNVTSADGTLQPAQQLATPSGSSQLPFTGLVLIPLIILGVAMLLVGLVLRSRSTRAPNS